MSQPFDEPPPATFYQWSRFRAPDVDLYPRSHAGKFGAKKATTKLTCRLPALASCSAADYFAGPRQMALLGRFLVFISCGSYRWSSKKAMMMHLNVKKIMRNPWHFGGSCILWLKPFLATLKQVEKSTPLKMLVDGMTFLPVCGLLWRNPVFWEFSPLSCCHGFVRKS